MAYKLPIFATRHCDFGHNLKNRLEFSMRLTHIGLIGDYGYNYITGTKLESFVPMGFLGQNFFPVHFKMLIREKTTG